MRTWIAVGAIAAFLGVATGAFGAHALKATLEHNGTLAVYQTGVQYHLIHALAILLVALLADKVDSRAMLARCGGLFAAGIVLFSGSLYALAITNVPQTGVIPRLNIITPLAVMTPFGGLCFLAGWALLAATALREKS